jgi:alkyl hydroperoxide reductase subunit AhpC
LCEAEEQFTRCNASVVVVTFEHDYFARQYVAETGLDWPLLIDENREVYRGYGMLAASFWDVWGPATWWAYFRALRKGEKLRTSAGDVMQRGGDVLIDPTGIVRLHHVGNGPADRPSVEAIFRRLSD